MDDFGMDRPELNGSLMSLEFGPGGRIYQLWASDANAPEDSEEFQFIAPPVAMGEELAEDYYPGTILLGARTHPEEPWIVSRNTRAEHTGDEDDPGIVTFNYEFAFLDELEAAGKFYEQAGKMPQVVWELSIRNRSRRSVEIGELGFPLALNNVLDGFPRTDKGVREMFHDRVHVHKFVGGSASYVYAQRMHGLPPGLLIFPGGDTKWEFYNHVPASLNTTYQWEGVPVVYVHSRAAIEREGWPEWFYGHSSTVLEPGETRRYEMRFATGDRVYTDGPTGAMAMAGRPSFKLYPAAVAPFDTGINIEIAGATPTRFWSDVDVEMENDSDEHGGFCYVKAIEPGTVRIGFEDTAGRNSETQILFTRPIGELIEARADWILSRQVVREGALKGAIVAADNMTGEANTDIRHFVAPFALKSGVADALFLAEKNVSTPVKEEIEALDTFLSDFLEQTVRNPADGAVGCVLPTTHGTAACFGYPEIYPITALLYGAMARISAIYGAARQPKDYLELGAETAIGMWRHALSDPVIDGPIPLMSYMPALADQLDAAGLVEQAGELRMLLDARWSRLARRKYCFAPAAFWEAHAFEEVLAAARHEGDLDLKDRVFRCMTSGKSLAPCWWWHGSDKRWGGGTEGNDTAVDNGELGLGSSSVATSCLLFSVFSRDYAFLPETYVRQAFAGMLGVWALVRDDGAAGMAFCPDAASGHFGMAPTTGDIGLALYHYLRWAGGYVLPTLGQSLAVFGCRFDVEEEKGTEVFTVRPWDGCGRRIVVRQIGLEVESSTGHIEELQFDARKRSARVSLQNASDKDLAAELVVKGMWGRRCMAAGQAHVADGGTFRLPVLLPARGKARIDIEVCE